MGSCDALIFTVKGSKDGGRPFITIAFKRRSLIISPAALKAVAAFSALIMYPVTSSSWFVVSAVSVEYKDIIRCSL